MNKIIDYVDAITAELGWFVPSAAIPFCALVFVHILHFPSDLIYFVL